jgi:hypothetical protein
MERYVQDEADEVQFSRNRVDGSIRGPSIGEAAESQIPLTFYEVNRTNNE